MCVFMKPHTNTFGILMVWMPFVLQAMSVVAETPDDVEGIFAELFSKQVYNKVVRGQNDLTQTSTVDMNFSLISIDTFDEVNDNLELMGVMYLSWKDERLRWQPEKHNGTKSIQVLQEMIWRPMVVLSNPSKEIDIPGFDNLLTTCYHDGTVFWWTGHVFKVRCSADVTSFPFDLQTCGMVFNVWGYTSPHVVLQNRMESMITVHYIKHGLWTLIGTGVSSYNFSHFQYIEYEMVIERKATFFLVNVLIPAILLGTLSLLVFLVPQESGERISYSITVLLSIGVFLNFVGAHLPANSAKMASICYLLLALLVISSISCVCNILSLQIFHRKPSTSIPKFVRIMLKLRFCTLCKPKQEMGNEDIKSTGEDADDLSLKTKGLQTDLRSCKTEYTTWQHISNVIDRICLVLLTGGFVFSLSMYAYNVVKGRQMK